MLSAEFAALCLTGAPRRRRYVRLLPQIQVTSDSQCSASGTCTQQTWASKQTHNISVERLLSAAEPVVLRPTHYASRRTSTQRRIHPPSLPLRCFFGACARG